MWEVSARAGGSRWFPTPVPAVRVRPNEIKLVTVQRRRLQNQTRGGDVAVTPTLPAPWGRGEAAGDRLQSDPRREGSVRDRNPWNESQGRLTASHGPLAAQKPRLAKDDRQTEAYTSKAEVSTAAKVVSSIRMAPSNRSGAMDGPDAPESSVSSVPSSPVVSHASRGKSAHQVSWC